MGLDGLCAVCRTTTYASASCPACDQLNCPREECGFYDLCDRTDLSKAAQERRWLCTHCVEEVIYGP